jgi:hypothetical protein
MTATISIQPARPLDRWNGVWLLAAVQYAYAIWFPFAVYLTLARAAHFEGHYFPLPALGDAATAEADITDGWQWSGLLMMTATAGPLCAGVSAAASIGLLVTRRVRAYRIQWITLLVSTLLVIATLAVALSPAGQQVSNWLLD